MPDANTPAAPHTYVLVHGAWHGGWCWRRVADRLQAAGHRVFTPTLTGVAERAHLMRPDLSVEDFLLDVGGLILVEELRDVILVGHSFGGRTVSLVADRMAGFLRHLVYLDAGLPVNGQSHLDGLPPAIRETRLAAAVPANNGVRCLPPPSAADLGVTDPADAAWVERRMTPQPFSTFTTPIHLRHPLGNGRPVTYIRCTDPAYAPMAASAERAKATPGWSYVELATGHDAMVTAPDALTAILTGLR
jgi:pimeloyl-ACP methyl ester carboxylesterase